MIGAIIPSDVVTPWLHPLMLTTDRYGLVLVGLTLGIAGWRTRTRSVAFATVVGMAMGAAGIAYLIARAVAVTARQPPPCAVGQAVFALEHCAAAYTFPDSIVAAATAVAAVLSWTARVAGVIAWLCTTMFMFARVYVGHVYLVDVVLALLIGVTVGVTMAATRSDVAETVARWAPRHRWRRGRR